MSGSTKHRKIENLSPFETQFLISKRVLYAINPTMKNSRQIYAEFAFSISSPVSISL